MPNKTAAIHIVAGPTAGGKSAFALNIARDLNGVIINADSLQIYDALKILTAHPPAEDLAQIPHEFYGRLHPNAVCSAGTWRGLVQPLIENILQSGKAPIVCGGTGLYIRALTHGLSPMPDIPDAIRARSIRMQKEKTAFEIHALVAARDPVMAAKLDPNNRARLVRAWEVFEATGKSLAEWQALPPEAPPAHWRFEIHKIMPERDELYRRCDERFGKMLEAGAAAEVESFGKRIESGEISPDVPVTRALGFKPLLAWIKGEISKDEAIARASADTRQYAKRQVTWFRHQL